MLLREVSELDDIIDNEYGLGSVPKNQEVDYFGIRVLMKPSKFLDLVALGEKRESVERIVDHLNYGGKIASPFLTVLIPDNWLDGDCSGNATIIGHEGRHRMRAVKKVLNNKPIEVHLFFRAPNREVRARHLNEEIIDALQRGMESEVGKIFTPNTFLEAL